MRSVIPDAGLELAKNQAAFAMDNLEFAMRSIDYWMREQPELFKQYQHRLTNVLDVIDALFNDLN